MTFAREKRLLLGAVAFLAPMPLPLNEVVGWPVLALYLVAVALFLRRAWRDPGRWLPPWAMNVLGLAYLPVLWLDLTVFFQGQLVRPVVHLAMFAIVVKLFALRREKDKWQVMLGVFFLFLTSMATSVHPTIMFYLLAVLGLGLVLLTRFSYYSVLARFGYRDNELGSVPFRGFLVVSTVASVLLAVPLFALLPRIQTPYILARGTGTGTVIHASGFSDIVTLDSIGSIRQSRQVVMRLRFDEQPTDELRFKAATYEEYDGRTWEKSPTLSDPLRRDRTQTFRLDEGPRRNGVEIWLLPLGSASLPLPVNALAVEARSIHSLEVDEGGAVSLHLTPSNRITYEVALARGPVLDLALPPTGPEDGALDTRAVSDRMDELAREVMGEGEDGLEKIRRLERYLATEYEYTTDYVGRVREDPLESFLFETKRGHCEYFATAMALMLRSQGVPSRLVTGFLGAEANPLERYYIVRQSNAHAWVEAWVEGEGWLLFDPTPPGGRPMTQEASLGLFMTQVYDYLIFRWDRYVLTYGFYDQMRIFSTLRRAWSSFWDAVTREREAEVPEPPTEDVTEMDLPTEPAQVTRDWRALAGRIAVLIALISLVVGALIWWRSRRVPTATDAYLRLREDLERAGLEVGDATAPLDLRSRAVERFPDTADSTSVVVELYLRESFGGVVLGDEETERAVRSLRSVEEVLRKAG